jgi:hypothetical protein
MCINRVQLENILFTNDGDMKLVDFGFSVMCRDPSKKLKIFCGTPSYMAPEIVMRKCVAHHCRPRVASHPPPCPRPGLQPPSPLLPRPCVHGAACGVVCSVLGSLSACVHMVACL